MEEYFLNLAAIVAITILVTETLENMFDTDGFATQALSWGTGVVITLFGWWMGYGFLADVEVWYSALLWGIGASLAANGVFDIPVAKKIVKAVIGFLAKIFK